MTFLWPHAFWLLLLPVGFAIAELTRRVRAGVMRHPKMLRAEASPRGLTLLGASGKTAAPEQRVRWRLWLGLMLAVVAFTRPQYGEIEEEVFEQAREILISVDLSRSMMAPDIAPSRLERSKLLIRSLLEELDGERVGLIVFAGTAFLQSPLSSDYEIMQEFLPSLGPDYLPAGGTDYSALLDTALDAFSNDSGADRFLIVLSDGESQTDAWQSRVEQLREREVHIITLGVGTAAGAMLPDGTGGFVKDERGAVVMSKLNHTTLEDLARRTGGVYRDASSWVDLSALLQQTVEAGRQGDFSETKRARKIERFQWALGPALLLLAWSLWREFPVQPRLRAVTLKNASRTATGAAVFWLLLLASPDNSSAQSMPPIGGASPVGAAEAPPLEAPLNALIGRLASKEQVTAPDYAEMAEQTLTYGQRVLQSGQPPAASAIYDALDAVDAGEVLDNTAADWPTLRENLQKLLEQADQPPQDQQQQDQDQNQDEQENKDQSQDQQNQSGGGGENQDQSEQGDEGENESSEGQSGDQGNEGEQGESSDENGDQQQQQNQQGDGNQQQDSEQSSDPQQNQSGQSEQPSEQQRENAESAFGDMNENSPETPPQPQPQPQPQPRPQETQTVGGRPTQAGQAPEDPALAVPMQKLDQLKQQDTPGQLFQLLQDPKEKPPATGRDW